jgi:porphobilinogen synthase
MSIATYPKLRLRRIRANESLCNLFQENYLNTHQLIAPLFVREKSDAREITTMPDVFRHLIEELPKITEELYKLGIRCVMLFPKTPAHLKNDLGSESRNPENLICRAIKTIKKSVPEMLVLADVALDPYTTHGHDGICNKNGYVVNDTTVAALVDQSLNQVKAGADGVCPSDMMDGRIQAIRNAFEKNEYHNTLIISYAAKYATCFYGPFRNAVGADLKGNKRTYQLNPANSQLAMREILQDMQEGADAIIIKPGLPYLDIIYQASQLNNCPVWAYQVSGEYGSIKFAAKAGIIDEKAAFLETAMSFKRSGAYGLITYAAKDLAKWIKELNG